MLVNGSSDPYASHDHAAMVYDYGGTVVGVSAFLSLFVPSFLFAASYAPVAWGTACAWPAGSTAAGTTAA